ncbi:MAG: ThuA domain-containing protein [Sphingomonadaceae bacterium]
MATDGPIQVHVVAAGKYHDIDFARLEILKLLADEPRIRASVDSDYRNTGRLAECALLVTYTCDLMPTPEEAAAIRSWLEAGGRWLALHGTNSILRFLEDGRVDSPAERDDVMDLLGTQFVAHPPIGPFTVRVARPDDPLVAGEQDFEVVDELYLSRTLGEIDILLDARFTGEATGFVEADWQDAEVPILYRRAHGKGGVLYFTLGHCRGHYDVAVFTPFWPHPERCAWNYPVYYRLLRRCLAWGIGRIA